MWCLADEGKWLNQHILSAVLRCTRLFKWNRNYCFALPSNFNVNWQAVGEVCLPSLKVQIRKKQSLSGSSSILLCKILPLFLQVDINDVVAINPELLELPPADVKENVPLQDNVSLQVSALK